MVKKDTFGSLVPDLYKGNKHRAEARAKAKGVAKEGDRSRMPNPETELGKNIHEPDQTYVIPVEDTNPRVIKKKGD